MDLITKTIVDNWIEGHAANFGIEIAYLKCYNIIFTGSYNVNLIWR